MAHAQLQNEAEGGDPRRLDSRYHLTKEIIDICQEIASYGGSRVTRGRFSGGKVVSYHGLTAEQNNELGATYAPWFLKSLARHKEITIRFYLGFPGACVELLVDGKKALEASKFTSSGTIVDSKLDEKVVTLELLDQLLLLKDLVGTAKGESIYRTKAQETLKLLERR